MRSLFRETDRAQRMNTDLCLILFDIDDFGHWNARVGAAACDQLLAKVVERVEGCCAHTICGPGGQRRIPRGPAGV